MADDSPMQFEGAAATPPASRARVAIGRSERRPPGWLFHVLALPFALAALVTMPRRFSLGPMSALAAFTIVQLGLLALALMVLGRLPRRLIVSCLPWFAFLGVALLGFAWAPLEMESIQNGLIYALFGLGVLLGGALAVYEPDRTRAAIERGMAWILWITLGIVAVQLLWYGVPVVVAAHTNSNWYVTPRSIALVLLISLSWYLSRWYYGGARAAIPCLALIVGQAATLSRLSTATGLVLVSVMVAFQARFRPARMLANLPVLGGLAIAAVAVALYYEPVRRRMFEGDTSLQVAGLRLNASGRMELWTEVIASARARPLLGHGLGSAQKVLGTQFSGEIAHPHNDYLRLWHDTGAIGAGLVLLAWGTWLVVLLRSWYRSEQRCGPPAADALAAVFALLGLLATMVADNAIVYPFVMTPLGIAVGAGLGPALVRRQARPAPFPTRTRAAAKAAMVGAGPLS